MGRRKKEEPKPKKYKAVQEIERKKDKSFRPNEFMASVDEAKEILRKRYESRNLEVSRVTRFSSSGFMVSFKDQKGPHGLDSVLCNWPYLEGADSREAAEKLLKQERRATGKEAPDLKAIMKDPKRRKQFLNNGFEEEKK